jgi:hypothetical protein
MSPLEKPEELHVDHAEVHESSTPDASALKITRDSYWDNKKGIAICLIINMAVFEYGLDQGMVVGFQAMPGFLMDFGYKDPSLPGGMGIATDVQQLMGSLVSLGMFLVSQSCSMKFLQASSIRISQRSQTLLLYLSYLTRT